MAFQLVKEWPQLYFEKDGPIGRLTMNDPDKLNRLGLFPGELLEQLTVDGLNAAADDPEVKVVILRGAGRAFCTGLDLSGPYRIYQFMEGKDLESQDRPSQATRLKFDLNILWTERLRRLVYFPKVTIAQVHGFSFEYGMYLGIMCDLTYAAEETFFGVPGQRIGSAGCGEPGLFYFLLCLGYKKWRELSLTGKRFDAQEAYKLGLVADVVPKDKLEDKVLEAARAICTYPADGITLGRVSSMMYLDTIGMHLGAIETTPIHSMGTNLKFRPGEWNFIKTRKIKGIRETLHEMHHLYSVFDPPDIDERIERIAKAEK